jgi:glycosyltransferase involved in cell wall biosynthesis
MSDQLVLISVCIATYRREELLRQLLMSLSQQRLESNVKMEIIVVDNDPEATASGVVDEFKNSNQCSIDYSVESARNLSMVRNQSVARAKGDLIAFIDDDEVAEPDWLQELFNTIRKYKADAVAGPVLPVYPDEIPQWIRQGRFFERPRLETGTEIFTAGTGNMLIWGGSVRKMGGPFDTVYGRTGGEDTDFYNRICGSGGRIVWADEAIVREGVPIERATIRYLTRRSFRNGQTYAVITLPGYSFQKKIAWFLFRSSISLIGVVLLPLFWLGGRIIGMKASRKIASNLGQLSALSPFRVKEY